MGRKSALRNTDPCRRLLRVVRDQPRPGHHFAGLTAPDLALPDNVRMLVRTKPEELACAPNLNPDVYVLLLSLRGEGTIVLEDRAIHLGPGRGVLIFPRQFHLYSNVAPRALCWLVISFSMRHDNGLEILRARRLRVDGAAETVLERMLKCYRNAGDFNPNTCARVALLLLECLLAWRAAGHRGARGGGSAAPRIEPAAACAIRYIFEHIDRPLTIGDVAGQVGVSVSSLQQIFRDVLGMTMGVYIRRARLHRVRFLLTHTELDIKQIASQSGFSSIQSFSRAFRRFAGMSPTACRKLQSVHWDTAPDM